MKTEDKKLLLQDLCGRLPYNVKCFYFDTLGNKRIDVLNAVFPNDERILVGNCSIDYSDSDTLGVMPYLFPLSSMTEEQYEEFIRVSGWDGDIEDIKRGKFSCIGYIGLDYIYDTIDWFVKNHFDWRGLIPVGLANDATGLNIY